MPPRIASRELMGMLEHKHSFIRDIYEFFLLTGSIH
jgi:hypothetical protein